MIKISEEDMQVVETIIEVVNGVANNLRGKAAYCVNTSEKAALLNTVYIFIGITSVMDKLFEEKKT